jgi:hypothetical protein
VLVGAGASERALALTRTAQIRPTVVLCQNMDSLICLAGSDLTHFVSAKSSMIASRELSSRCRC